MKQNRILLIISIASCILWAGSYINGQKNSNNIMNEIGINLRPHNMYSIDGFDNRYSGVKGSPLLSESWNSGTICFSKDNRYANEEIELAIDGFNDELLILLGNESIITIKSSDLEKVIVKHKSGHDSFIVASPEQLQMKNERPVFLQYLTEGKYRLYKYTKKVFLEADFKDPYSVDRRHDEFRNEVYYFVENENGSFNPVKPRLKSIQKQMPERSQFIREIAEQYNLDLSQETSLVFLFEKINES